MLRACRDGAGAYLDRDRDYRRQILRPASGKPFWSVTVSPGDHRRTQRKPMWLVEVSIASG